MNKEIDQGFVNDLNKLSDILFDISFQYLKGYITKKEAEELCLSYTSRFYYFFKRTMDPDTFERITSTNVKQLVDRRIRNGQNLYKEEDNF